MITISDVFEQSNLDLALEDLLSKPNTCGIDGIMISEFREYWDLNQARIIDSIVQGRYTPGPVKMSLIVGKKGKRRYVATMNSVDRLICRAIMQVMQDMVEGLLSDACFSYRPNKSTKDAVDLAASFMQAGNRWVGEVDVENFFDSIPKDRIFARVSEIIKDESLKGLLHSYIYQEVENDGEIYQPKKGVIQGSPLSPMFSNLYLSEMDQNLTDNGYLFYRYGDDINVYCKSFDEANDAIIHVASLLHHLGLSVNQKKGGVYIGINRKALGYEFVEKGDKVIVRRIAHSKTQIYRHWTQTSIQQIGSNYHLINDGIITRKDFTVLFENTAGKYYIPVETIDSLNVYSNIVFSSEFFNYMNEERLMVNFVDRMGNKIGTFIPQQCKKDYKVEQAQIELLNNTTEHLKIAKKYQNANVFNLRAILRYYQRRSENAAINEAISRITQILQKINEVKDLESLMIYEAQARQIYFQSFNEIISDEHFRYRGRSRRPPRDALNAMISFGNTLLYQRFASEIYASKLDIRFGILHNSHYRAESLNLDLADLFKPVIVDRTIFTLVNRKMLSSEEDFRSTEKEGVYLSERGKRIFIQEFEGKLNQRVEVGKRKMSYDAILRNEVRKVQQYFQKGEPYKPYKYVN